MKNINRALEEIEKEGFSHILKGCFEESTNKSAQYTLTNTKDKNIIHFLKENILQLLTQVVSSKNVQGTWDSFFRAFILESQGSNE